MKMILVGILLWIGWMVVVFPLGEILNLKDHFWLVNFLILLTVFLYIRFVYREGIKQLKEEEEKREEEKREEENRRKEEIKARVLKQIFGSKESQ